MRAHPIVICSDDQRLLGELPGRLRRDGYQPHTAQAKRQLFWALAERRPAALVLGDLPTPPETLALLREVRSLKEPVPGVDPDLPVLVLSGAPGRLCELAAFAAGADDFQSVAITYPLLRARLAALIARSQITDRAERVAAGPLWIDRGALEARYDGQLLELTQLEFALLYWLAREPARVFSRQELLVEIWGYPGGAGARTRTVDRHANALRRKLAEVGAPGAIQSRRGVGYRLGLPTPPARPLSERS